jgi:phosphoenolpyruvate carboxylase
MQKANLGRRSMGLQIIRTVREDDAGAAARPAGDVGTVDDLVDELLRDLGELRERSERDPFANPIQLSSLETLARLRSGALTGSTLERLIQRLTARAFIERAERLRQWFGEVDEGRNADRLAGLIRRQAFDADGSLLPLAKFQGRLERIVYGFVITAHPTFSLNVALQRKLMETALGPAEPRDAPLGPFEAALHVPEAPLDLAEEHRQAQAAIEHLIGALEHAFRITFDVARELYPADWRALTPRLVSIASWVGYDTDGRSDISWATTFEKRLRSQLAMLARYRGRITRLCGRAQADERLLSVLELTDARLSLAIKACEDELKLFGAPPPHGSPWLERLAVLSRDMAAARERRLTDSRQLLSLIERALAQVEDDELALELAVLRAEVRTHGLATARTHVRINAIQLHNSIRKTIGMEHPADDPSHRLTYVNAVAQLIERATPASVNFGSVATEKATARRVFMTMAQMLKFLDAAEPIRFLIAECETPLTLLTALYFARLFGVEDRIDISPLFETRKALERGAAILDGALQVPAYRDYVRRRGRICLQTGFSDAGRYMGQIAASMAIERIRLQLSEMLARHGLADLELVIFDTHGESIGRGAHPESLSDRFRYYDTPESRRRLSFAGIRLRQESSWQGGDGYLPFTTKASSFAVIVRALEHTLEPADEGEDPYYDRQDYGDEFLAAVKQFNTTVIEDPCYAAFLGAWGLNLLYPAGSRPVQRQYDTAGARVGLEHPSQIRAIPHNSILQQVGILANTIGGLGQAVGKDPEAFQRLYNESPRFRRLMRMVEHAFKFTDLTVVRSYVDLFDPGAWLVRAQASKTAEEQEELSTVAAYLERIGIHDRLMRIYRVFQRDYMDLARALREHRRRTRDKGEQPIAVDAATRDNMHLLHALRLALIQQLMIRSVHIPDFSDRHSVNHAGMIQRLMHLEVEPALTLLAEIFPISDADAPELDFGEPATYRGSGNQSYAQEHETLFRPIGHDYEMIRRIGSAIIHHLGAIG